MRSDGGGVFDVQDRINGLTLCGCNTIAACQAGAPMGACKNIGAPNRNSSSLTSSSAVNGNVYSGTTEFKTHTSGGSTTFVRASFVILMCLLSTLKGCFDL
jgi:hypothetical protein